MNINEEKRLPSVPHCVSMEDRRSVSFTGIVDVDSFDEQNIVLITNTGELSVRGSGLRVGKLSTDTGEMSVEGKIDALVYTDDAPRQSGFFSKVFR